MNYLTITLFVVLNTCVAYGAVLNSYTGDSFPAECTNDSFNISGPEGSIVPSTRPDLPFSLNFFIDISPTFAGDSIHVALYEDSLSEVPFYETVFIATQDETPPVPSAPSFGASYFNVVNHWRDLQGAFRITCTFGTVELNSIQASGVFSGSMYAGEYVAVPEASAFHYILLCTAVLCIMTVAKSNKANGAIDLATMSSALLSRILLPQDLRQKQVAIGHRGRWAKK